jgi:hypothetical protein
MSLCKRRLNNSEFSKTNEESLEKLRSQIDVNTGMFGQGGYSTKVKRINAEHETVINGTVNSFIVLGNDRTNSLASNYGARNASDCAAIDFVVGTGIKTEVDNNEEKFLINPNFRTDAARIYISQMTDIDDNFYIKTKSKSIAKSGIGIKADDVRIIGREKIKLVTGTDKFNSKDCNIESRFGGIELIAGNSEEDLQPLVLGDNLKEYLVYLNNKIDTFYNIFFNFYTSQSDFNEQVAKHTHNSPFFGEPTLLNANIYISDKLRSIENLINVDMASFFWKHNKESMENKYLLSKASKKYILSQRNKTN